MDILSPSAFELGLAINRGYEQPRIEGIRKLRGADNHLFQGLEDILGDLLHQRRVIYPRPVDIDVKVSQLSVADLESVALEKAVPGPFLGIVEADVNLADESIRKGGKDLVLGLLVEQQCVVLHDGLNRPDR